MNVQDAFNGGGDQSGPSLNRRALIAIYKNTTITQGPHVLRFGARLRRIKVNDESGANFGGTFTFAGGNEVVLDIDNQVVRNTQGEPLFNKVLIQL